MGGLSGWVGGWVGLYLVLCVDGILVVPYFHRLIFALVVWRGGWAGGLGGLGGWVSWEEEGMEVLGWERRTRRFE